MSAHPEPHVCGWRGVVLDTRKRAAFEGPVRPSPEEARIDATRVLVANFHKVLEFRTLDVRRIVRANVVPA